jgi:beta-galactosidase GanA
MNSRDVLYLQGKAAVTAFCKRVSQRGLYRIIRDPEGTVSIWDILDTQNKPFTITFVDRGQKSQDLERMSPVFVQGMLQCLGKELGSRIQ